MLPPVLGRWSLTASVAALALAGAAWLRDGGSMFSPGALHAGDSTRTTLGGVTAHAALGGRCGRCHAAPWSGASMSGRCLDCHTDIVEERRDTTTLHGRLSETGSCMACHTEHAGPSGELTRLDESFDHAATRFPLDGAHRDARCAACHEGEGRLADFRSAPVECIGCHREDDEHRGEFGAECGECHTTSNWKDAAFEHEFPLDHGDEGRIACKTCHEDRKNYEQYTCYGCHEHSPDRIRREHDDLSARELENCVRCHPTGREHEGREGNRRSRGDEDDERRARGRDH